MSHEVGASSRIEVHNLLARRATALANGDEETVTAIDAELAAMGYDR